MGTTVMVPQTTTEMVATQVPRTVTQEGQTHTVPQVSYQQYQTVSQPMPMPAAPVTTSIAAPTTMAMPTTSIVAAPTTMAMPTTTYPGYTGGSIVGGYGGFTGGYNPTTGLITY